HGRGMGPHDGHQRQGRLPRHQKRHSGHAPRRRWSIINISSHPALVGTANSSRQYQASKGAVRLLTKATAIQYSREGIRANSVHPGPIVTAMTERRRADPAQRQLMISRIPLGRYGEPDEVAYGVLYLASDEAAYVTGSELVIDGGWTAQWRAGGAGGAF